MATPNNTLAFFIVGRERSGTTMLRVNLNNHPNIHIPPESPFILHLHKKYKNQNRINVTDFLSDLKTEPFIHTWKISYKKLEQQLEGTETASFSKFCEIILNQYYQNNILLGDKNPTYSLFGIQLSKIFPEAKFIWIIRDYRAQVNSMLKVNFEKKVVSSLAARWVGYNKKIQKLKNKTPNQVLLIKYEDLVNEPKKNYTEICQFIRTNYVSSILETGTRDKSEFYADHHISLNEKINSNHIDEWRNELTLKQIKICEAVAGDYGLKFGYKKEFKTNQFIIINLLPGIFYGKSYLLFIRLMYMLPISVRVFINRNIIHKYANFWKDVRKH